MLWGDQWFHGVCGSSRREPCGRFATLVRYVAVGGWAAQGSWHVLDDERWRKARPRKEGGAGKASSSRRGASTKRKGS